MTRSELKQLIRECLVEIITEGAERAVHESTARRPVAPPPDARQHTPRRTINGVSLDRMVGQPSVREAAAAKVNANAASSAAKKLTADPVLSQIFADTAATTLQEQYRVEGRRGPDAASADPVMNAISNVDPTDIFGSAASNWATLAFSDKPRP